MAVATGAIVANLYYLQPLLPQIARDFSVGSTGAASLVTSTQVGYGLGLGLVLPLGDLIARRRLVVAIFIVAGVLMALGASLHAFAAFAVIALFTGVASVGGQVMIPFAADLARDNQRGRVIARLMMGLLLGVLLCRSFAGIVTQFAGWRTVYWLAAILMGLMALLLARSLPEETARPHVSYRRLITGSVGLLASLPELRRRAWLGAGCFAAFSILWTTLAFKLSAAPYGYSSAVIGLFGLIGAAGVLAANGAGRMADRGRQSASTMVAGALTAGSFLLLAIGGHLIVPMIIGIIALDLGVQGMQITNQSIIYALAPDARSRINSAYMVCYFAGGALGSLIAGLAYSAGGWNASCAFGALIGFSVLFLSFRWRKPASTAL